MQAIQEVTKGLQLRIFEALIGLMGEKTFEDITVSDIANRAQISRMSFYRAFKSKEEVLLNKMNDIISKYLVFSNLVPDEAHHISMKNIVQVFCLYNEHREFVLACFHAGLDNYFLSGISEYLHEHFTNEEDDYKRVYLLDIYASAICTSALTWICRGAVEPPEEMAGLLYEVFGSHI